MGAPESILMDDKRVSGQHSRYRMFDEFNERDQSKLFQSLGLLGFFRRKNLPDIGFDAASVIVLVGQRQSEGKTTTYEQWQKMLGLKADASAKVCEELGLPFKLKARGKTGAIAGEIELPQECGVLVVKGCGDENTEVSLSMEGKKLIEDLMRLSVFKE